MPTLLVSLHPLTGHYYPHDHPEQMVRTKGVTQGTPCVYRAHRAQTFCPSDLQSLLWGQMPRVLGTHSGFLSHAH